MYVMYVCMLRVCVCVCMLVCICVSCVSGYLSVHAVRIRLITRRSNKEVNTGRGATYHTCNLPVNKSFIRLLKGFTAMHIVFSTIITQSNQYRAVHHVEAPPTRSCTAHFQYGHPVWYQYGTTLTSPYVHESDIAHRLCFGHSTTPYHTSSPLHIRVHSSVLSSVVVHTVSVSSEIPPTVSVIHVRWTVIILVEPFIILR